MDEQKAHKHKHTHTHTHTPVCITGLHNQFDDGFSEVGPVPQPPKTSSQTFEGVPVVIKHRGTGMGGGCSYRDNKTLEEGLFSHPMDFCSSRCSFSSDEARTCVRISFFWSSWKSASSPSWKKRSKKLSYERRVGRDFEITHNKMHWKLTVGAFQLTLTASSTRLESSCLFWGLYFPCSINAIWETKIYLSTKENKKGG